MATGEVQVEQMCTHQHVVFLLRPTAARADLSWELQSPMFFVSIEHPPLLPHVSS